MLAATAVAVGTAPTTASATTPAPARVVDTAAWSLTITAAKRTDCRTTRATRGVASRGYRTPVEGVLQAKLQGPSGSDWDLSVVDSAGGRVLGASLGFGAREVVAVPVGAAQRVLLRVCRRSGSGRSARLAVRHAALLEAPAPKRMSLVEVDVRGGADHARLDALGFDTADHSDGRTLKIVLYGSEDATRLLRAGFPFRTLVADVAAKDRRDRDAERRADLRGVRTPLPSGRTTYRTLADHQADMKKLAEEHPDLVRGFVLPGTSLEGRQISGVEIAAGVKRTDDGRPHYYIDGVNHAREWPAGEVPTEFAFDLVKNPKGDGALTRILNDVRTFIVPIVNVDGFDASRTAGVGVFETVQFGDLPWAANGAGTAYKRKNCRWADQNLPAVPCLAAHVANDMGVDTNRNYGFGWGGPGASISWATMTYRGAAAFSEPETTALRKFMFGIQPAVVVSNHTVAALMLRPPGQQGTPDTPDEEPMKALGDAMGEETGYRSQRSWQLYDTTGTTIDWTYGSLGAWSYTPELGGAGFHAAFDDSVVAQYDGSGEHGGMRAALILAGNAVRDRSSHATLVGRAPAGRTLRVSRTFITTTWDKTPLEQDVHTSSITVPNSGRFEWAVTPSRRPYEAAGTWKLECLRDGDVVESKDIAIERGQRVEVDLPCGGSLAGGGTGVGGGAAAPGAGGGGGGAAAPGCADLLRSVRVRATRRDLRVAYRSSAPGRVRIELLRGSKRLRSARGGARAATLKRGARVRNGRYTVRITLVAADGRRDVRTVSLRKQGRRVRVGAARRGCR